MGRKRLNVVHKYYDYDESDKYSRCLMANCTQRVKGRHGSNLLYHFRHRHKDEYERIMIKNMKNRTEITIGSNKKNLLAIMQNSVNLVTVHGRPFSLFSDEAFKNIIKLVPMSTQERNSINSHSIKQSIKDKANEIRKAIQEEVKSRLVALRVDIASFNSHRFVGLNIQYIDDDKIMLRSLGTMEIFQTDTRQDLKEKINCLLCRYGIQFQQIYSITTDYDPDDISSDDLIGDSWLHIEIDEVDNSLKTKDKEETDTISIRSVSHSLQLAIKSALNDLAEPILEDCHKLSLLLTSPQIAKELENKRLPVLDSPIQISVIDMFEWLLNLKAFCQNHADDTLHLPNWTWKYISDTLKAILPYRGFLKSLQNEQIFGDFYCSWLKCILETKKINTPFALYLSTCMKDVQENLLDNKYFVSALYLDPRINATLSAQNIKKAHNHLMTTFKRIVSRKPVVDLELNRTPKVEPDEPSTSETSELDSFIQMIANENRTEEMANTESCIMKQMEYNLRSFLKISPLPAKTNILQFWFSKKVTDPQLFMLSNVILATLPTQGSIRKLVSSLKFVFTNYHRLLQDDIIQDILVIRNHNLNEC